PNGAYADLFLLIAPDLKGYKASVFDQVEIGASMESTPMDRPFGPIFSHMRPKELPYTLDQGVSLELCALRKIQDQILIGASLGSMKRAFEEARDFTKARRRGDRPLIACQEVGFKLAEIFTLLDASRHLALRAFWAEEIADREKDVLLFSAKAFCVESSERVLSEAIQIMGKEGFEGPLKELYLFSKLFGVLGTPTERARVNIGDLLLGV
ncbi:MAG: acyl-CoA dehydrogenase family protein, partial [Desulfatiglandales bacterium]